nr:MAG TPA: hypothetical protein [Caudoviricetes sp.]
MQVCGFTVSLQCLIIHCGRRYGSSTYMEGHFLCSSTFEEQRYRRTAPWLHCNGVVVLFTVKH